MCEAWVVTDSVAGKAESLLERNRSPPNRPHALHEGTFSRSHYRILSKTVTYLGS